MNMFENPRIDFGARSIVRTGEAAILAGTTAAAAILIEPEQTTDEKFRARGLPLPDSATVVDFLASLPLDAKAVGLSAAVLSAGALFDAGRMMSTQLPGGIEKDTVMMLDEQDRTPTQRLRRTVATYAGAGVAAVAAYKYGAEVPADTALFTSFAALGTGAVSNLVTDAYLRRRYRNQSGTR
ncbi:MAG: hypothetical protein H0W89_00570 [Candidatus Levybacteria bacterium]|nr:hypothetical protein [Candidatus Levybacteria bacterium]